MTQPLSHPDLRRRNLALLLGTLLRHGEATRKQVEEESGLSKATISRLVDELLQAGALVTTAAAPVDPTTRGRRAGALRAPAALGVVAGLSLGVRTTSIVVTDLVGRELAWQQLPTPKWTDFDEAADWATGVVASAVDALGAPLRHLVVTVPARAIDGSVITRAPLFMSVIEGPQLCQTLTQRLGCPVRIELDAAMVLAGLEALGAIDRASSPVLLNLGSVLTMSLRRRDGTIAGGATASFGDFSLIPIETDLGPSALGTLLGAHGLFEASERLGPALARMEELWQTDTEQVRQLREAFRTAITQVIRIIVVMSDPNLIIFTGRLSPLVRRYLDEIEAVLAQELEQPPVLRVVGQVENDHPAAVGAAREALTEAVAGLLDRVSQQGLPGLA